MGSPEANERETDMTITWSKGKQGDWMVRGPIGLSGTVTVSKRDGSTSTAPLAKCVWEGDGVALYAVGTSASTERRSHASGRTYDPQKFNGYGAARGGYRRACKSDGNCSSIGSGRSCGGHDCDGY